MSDSAPGEERFAGGEAVQIRNYDVRFNGGPELEWNCYFFEEELAYNRKLVYTDFYKEFCMKNACSIGGGQTFSIKYKT